MKVIIVLIASILASAAADVSVGELDNTMEIAMGFVKDCQGDYGLCVKEKLLRMLDNVRQSKTIKIAEGVVLKSNNDFRSPKKVDLLPLEPAARDEEVNSRLIDGVIGFFETHSLEVQMDKNAQENVARSLQAEGRGQKKKNAQAAAVIGLMVAKLLFGKLFIVKLIALKALAVAKIALVLGIILVVAYCLQQGHSKTTYEVIPHHGGHDHHEHHEHAPIHLDHSFGGHAASSHEHAGYSYGGGSDWNKNIDDGQNLAYSAYSGH